MNPHDIHHAMPKDPSLSAKVLDAAVLAACVIMGGLVYIIY